MNAAQILTLHTNTVKAAQKWEAATPGTVTKERLYQAWQKAEKAFEAALQAPDFIVDGRPFRNALEKIASEQNVYKGHGNYDTVPAYTADEAQGIARAVLSLCCNHG